MMPSPVFRGALVTAKYRSWQAALLARAEAATLMIIGHEGEAADGHDDRENSPQDEIENHLSIQKAVIRITAE